MTNDKRIAETREKLRNALTELLLTEPMESISIRMITDKAGVNRSTFYAHYTCQRDLIDEMEEELLSHLPVFSSSAHDDIAKTFTAFMSYVKEKRDIVKILMTEGVDNSFGERLIKIVMDRYEEFSPFDDEELSRMNYVFCINGIVGLVRDWINSGCSCPVEKMAGFSIEMAFRASGIDRMIRKKR